MNDYLEIAICIAAEAHKGQVDKNGMPYILHPLAVMMKVGTLELKVIAVLHDTIEDTYVTPDYLLENGIPEKIVEVVELLTKKDDETYEEYLRKVKQNPLAKAVKLADLAHNTDPERASGLNEERRKKYELAKKIMTED